MNDTVSEDVKLDTDGLEAALDEAKYWDEGFTSSPREYQVLRIVGDEVETISRHPDRASMEAALYAARMSACIRAYLAATKPALADVTRINMGLLNQLTDWFNRLPGESLGKTHFDALIAIVTASPPMPGRGEGWRTDFDAPDIRDRPLIVYATDDDGYAFGLAGWNHDNGAVTLAWGHHPHNPINDGIERALCWKHIDYPGKEWLDELASRPKEDTQQ